jgi:hypothetical protein
MAQEYSRPEHAADPYALLDIEIFELPAEEAAAQDEDTVIEFMRRPNFRFAGMSSRTRDRMIATIIEEQGITGGWFWRAWFPGYLPDGYPVGPFDTYDAALAHARECVEEC